MIKTKLKTVSITRSCIESTEHVHQQQTESGNFKGIIYVRRIKVMTDPPETSCLLVNTASEDSLSMSSPRQWKSVCISCPPSKHLCLPSKAAILILLWTATVGAIYNILVGSAALLQISNARINSNISVYEPLPYAILALVMMFYPLSGFIADVCCGRLKAVVVSLMFLLSFWIFA